MCRAVCLYLAGPDFDVEVIPLVGDFEDFGPSKSVDPQPVPVDEQATRTNSQHDLHTLRVLETTQTRRHDETQYGNVVSLLSQEHNGP